VKKLLLIFLLLPLAFGTGCKSSKVKIPSGIMPEKKMQSVMLDVLIAEGYLASHNLGIDSSRKTGAKLYDEVFAKHKITKDDYTRSYNFYALHPELFENTIAPVIDSLNAMEARIPVFSRPATIVNEVKPMPVMPLNPKKKKAH
jgi:hypothetical protein